MRNPIRNLWISSLAAFTTAVPAALAGEKGVMDVLWTCSTDTETRSLSIGEKDGNGCELHYEKNGAVKVISWSSISTAPCIRTRDKIRDELKKAGWKCTKTNM
ncbi:MAG: hypothetical protein JST04_16140 [Bdellovibrionales bacterium]|nr:hypothetical protein [Bdellovibrionales bacterium]